MGSGPGEGKNADEQEQHSMNTLTRLGNEEVQKGDLQKALKFFEDAAEKAKKEGDSRAKVSCFLNAGACLVSLGQHKKGLLILEQAIAIIKDAQEGDSQAMEVSADVFYNAATAATALKDLEKAVTYFTASVERYDKLGSRKHAAEALESLAGCHRDTKDVEKQMVCLGRAQQLYKETANIASEALTNIELAKAYQSVRKFDTCKQMLGTAQELSSKLDSTSVKDEVRGKLYMQLGMVYTSLGMFDDAMRNFEQALPLALVSEEASILQNMGAIHNERGRYSDAVTYHKKAAALHGRNKNYNSEAKCLCNLAVAESCLGDYGASKLSYLHAHRQAELVRNLHLQFQASEGLGTLCIQSGHLKEAAHHLRQALKVLDKIGQDTGMARERVMEKLSDATEALDMDSSGHGRSNPAANLEMGNSPGRHPHALSGGLSASVECLPVRTENSTLDSEEQVGTAHISRRGAEFTVDTIPLSVKRMVLPPIRSPKLTRAANDSSRTTEQSEASKSPPHRNATTKRKKTKAGTMDMAGTVGVAGTTVQVPSTYDQQLNAYVASFGGSPSPAPSSGEEQSDHVLGASVFSRNATRACPRLLQSPTKVGGGGASTGAPMSPQSVREGSLAIGPHAWELFTTGTTMVEREHRKGKGKAWVQTEIIPIGTHSGPQVSVPEGTHSGSQTSAPEEIHSGPQTSISVGICSGPQVPPVNARGQPTPAGQSRVCLIL